MSYRFDPGAACLDLVFTGGEGSLAVFERLHTPEDWMAWLAEDSRGIELAARPGPAATARSHRLREVLRRLTWTIAHGQHLSEDLLEELNEQAAQPALAPRLSTSLRRTWHAPTLDQVTASLAREAVDLFANTPPDRFHECAADDCALLFVDTSRPGRRRWCSMERCGNRAKVRQHRRQ